MRFLYKIYSGYDGFRPQRINERLNGEGLLPLGWRRYLDEVDPGDEVWVYFHGPGSFENGVYIEGRVREVDRAKDSVLLRPLRSSHTERLTDVKTSRRIADEVAARGQQVFVVPEDWGTGAACNVDSTASTCGSRRCEDCTTWQHIRLVRRSGYWWPPRLTDDLDDYVPAYWVIVSRGAWSRNDVKSYVARSTDLFYRFKVGEKALAFPLALGMYRALSDRGYMDFDCIIPIPLSPDKAQEGELNRTRALARELSRLIGAPVVDALSLKSPISKRRLALPPAEFESTYAGLLRVSRAPTGASRILIVDDVTTRGSTLSCASRALRAAGVSGSIIGTTAGLMLTRAVVAKETQIAR